MNKQTYTVFIEYRISDQHWDEFRKHMSFIRKSSKENATIFSHQFLVGSEQFGNVVEIISVPDWESYQKLKAHRKSDSPEWKSFFSLIQGGKEKLNIWIFEPIDTENS